MSDFGLGEKFGSLTIPDDQAKRQAISSLRGYIYQIYQSLNAWITLKEDEILLLEVAEDFAVVAKDALNCVQVKDTSSSGSVTLRTDSVAQTIQSLWQFQQANPDTNASVTYLTTSEIGKERGLTFPNNCHGIAYWRIAARENTDVEPIRQALLELSLPSDLTDFIRTAMPDDLRNKILRKINWACGEKDIEALRQTILDRLVNFGNHLGFTPTDSEKACDSLVAEILKKIVDETSRKLSKADLLRSFEKAISVSLPTDAVRKLFNSISPIQGSTTPIISTGIIINAAQIPLPPRAINRHRFVDNIVSDMAQSGALWLHGSSGVGKTVLAQCIARKSKYDWLLVQLRDFTASEVNSCFRNVLHSLHTGNIGGIILDDFPTRYAHAIKLQLLILVNEVHRIDGSIIITSNKSPSPNIQECFGENGLTIFEVPYLSREEVAELIKLAGGDEDTWAGRIHSFCGFGHPQLVQARITGLKQRNWPRSELLNDIPSFEPSKETTKERNSIRERLLDEIPLYARDLLYRLTLLVGYFDRELAISIGEVEPAINCPGEAMDILIGPWLEMLANNYFRISPLVSDAGQQTLSKSTQTQIHNKIIDSLLKRKPFHGHYLGTLLSHSLIARNVEGLTWLTMAIMNTPETDRKAISEHLFLLPLLDTNKILFPENIYVSAMLRLSQFRIAAWANKTEYLPAIADQLIVEARMVKNKEIADNFLYLAIVPVLIEQSLKISPKKWMPLFQELEEALSGSGEFAELIRKTPTNTMGPENWTIPQFAFILRATSLKSIAELVELFSEFDQMESQRRKALLDAIGEFQSGIQLLIDSPWLADTKQKDFDAVSAADIFRQLAGIAESWGNTEIAVCCECARVIMFDEYANDSKSAIISLDEAAIKYPKQLRLARRRVSVYYRNGNYALALESIAQIAELMPEDEYIERAFVFREAGVSAANIGEFKKASHYFSEAYKAANALSGNMRIMAIGLKADQALSEFQAENVSEALNLMKETLANAEKINPEAGKYERYCILSLETAVLWMNKQFDVDFFATKEMHIAQGYCRRPEPPEKILQLSYQPFVGNWYLLAFLEVATDINVGIIDELKKRTRAKKILLYEFFLNYFIMSKYINSTDIENFFLYLPEYVSKVAHASQNHQSNNNELIDIDLSIIVPEDWIADLHIQYAKDAILSLIAVAICSNMNIEEQLYDYFSSNPNISLVLSGFLTNFENDSVSDKDDIWNVYIFHLGQIKQKECINPDELFTSTYYIWQWLIHSNFQKTIENRIANYLVECWQNIIECQRFNLQQPMTTVPEIQKALQEPTKGTVKVAKLLLACEIAVKRRLSIELRNDIKQYSLKKQP